MYVLKRPYSCPTQVPGGCFPTWRPNAQAEDEDVHHPREIPRLYEQVCVLGVRGAPVHACYVFVYDDAHARKVF